MHSFCTCSLKLRYTSLQLCYVTYACLIFHSLSPLNSTEDSGIKLFSWLTLFLSTVWMLVTMSLKTPEISIGLLWTLPRNYNFILFLSCYIMRGLKFSKIFTFCSLCFYLMKTGENTPETDMYKQFWIEYCPPFRYTRLNLPGATCRCETSTTV